ncbi:MAG: ComF family protein [Alphaproteobacteria bacterium]|nr:ComF family protein [Alphaproteobacteria bacterium]
MSIELEGNWDNGLAYDIHTLDSTYLGVDENGRDRWENTRSEMGTLVYGLKYNHKKGNIAKIIDLITAKIKGLDTFDLIIPIPPTKHRFLQPVEELAKELGRRKRVRVINALEKMPSDTEIKNVNNPEERKKTLRETMRLTEKHDFSGKKILLLDDLFRSGITLEVATNILYNDAKAERVCVLTMTKTRSNR